MYRNRCTDNIAIERAFESRKNNNLSNPDCNVLSVTTLFERVVECVEKREIKFNTSIESIIFTL